MARQHIPLKARVRYEGKAQIIDRRAASDADLENVPNPVYRMVTQVLRKFKKPAPAAVVAAPVAAVKKSRGGRRPRKKS